MAKKGTSISLPSGDGTLIGGVASSYKTKFDFGPKALIVFAVIVALGILTAHIVAKI